MIKRYYKEMPWILFDGEDFDLELEKFKTADDIIDFIGGLFQGKTKADKFSHKIYLSNWEEKTKFFNNMIQDSGFKMFIRNRLNKNEQELLDVEINRGFNMSASEGF